MMLRSDCDAPQAAELVKQIGNDDHPPHGLVCDRGQLAREGRRFLLLALGLRGAYLLGNALAREAKLQVDGNEGEEGDG